MRSPTTTLSALALMLACGTTPRGDVNARPSPAPRGDQEEPMTITLHNPTSIAPPFSRYSHGASAPAGVRWLYVSGQVGVTPDGVVPDDPERQITLAWDNVEAVLADAGMTVDNLVKVDGFITSPSLVPLYRKERERRFARHAAATTMVIVAGLAEPNLVVEIHAVAAR
jgi:enamine deaminase RidA (YjgF/YER057c/UK114 family)